MKRHKIIGCLVLVSAFLACDPNDATTAEPSAIDFIFEDGFETQNNTIDELFKSDGSRWTTIQQDDPTNAVNEISISETTFSEGQNSLRIFAYASDGPLSKMDIEKSGFQAFEDDRVIVKADFYISGTATIENLFLIDLECCSCWDPTVNVENQCPGVRLKMSGGNDFLSMERGKIAEGTIEQTSFKFPRDEWVSVQWELTLSNNTSGINRLLVNETEVIHTNGTNMPNARTFRELFAEDGINFTLQQPTFYERVQIGATANPTSRNVEMFIDNFSIKVEKNQP